MVNRFASLSLALLFGAGVAGIGALSVSAQAAETPSFEIAIKAHQFEPSELTVPAHTKIKLVVSNLDPSAEEFESYELNREKIIAGGTKAVIFVGPLEPGTYPFFGEFNQKTAQGKLIAK